jgi:hypothetical protein
VATVRLSIWYLMIQRALGAAARGTPPMDDAVAYAQRFLDVSREVGVTHMSEFYGPPGEQLEKGYYPRIRALIRLGALDEPDPNVMRGVAAFFSNSHRTYTVVDDEDALSGSCACQTADRRWTLTQGIRWGITRLLEPTDEGGEARRYQLRARIKIDKHGDEGPAFRLGYMALNRDWSARICASVSVDANELADGEWEWIALPEPVRHVAADRGLNAFVVAANNADNVERVCVDLLELVPLEQHNE